MAYFIAIRQEDLALIPPEYSRNLRMCAAALLNFFRNCQQFEGWWPISISKLHEKLLGQFGKDAIAQAGAVLDSLGLVKRQNNRLNHRAWEYKYTGARVFKVQNSAAADVSGTVTEVSGTVAEAAVTVADCSADIDHSLDNSSNYSEESNNVSATADFFEEEVNQGELKALGVKPEEAKECINRNSFNYQWALHQLKKFIFTGNCKNPTGYLMSRLSCRKDKSSAETEIPRDLTPKPTIAQLESLCLKYGSDNVGQTVLDLPEMGYPFAWVVVIDEQYKPWWEVNYA